MPQEQLVEPVQKNDKCIMYWLFIDHELPPDDSFAGKHPGFIKVMTVSMFCQF